MFRPRTEIWLLGALVVFATLVWLYSIYIYIG